MFNYQQRGYVEANNALAQAEETGLTNIVLADFRKQVREFEQQVETNQSPEFMQHRQSSPSPKGRGRESTDFDDSRHMISQLQPMGSSDDGGGAQNPKGVVVRKKSNQRAANDSLVERFFMSGPMSTQTGTGASTTDKVVTKEEVDEMRRRV